VYVCMCVCVYVCIYVCVYVWNTTSQGKTCRAYVSEFFCKLGDRLTSLLLLSSREPHDEETRFLILARTTAPVMNLHRLFHRTLSIPESFIGPLTLKVHQAAKVYVLSAWERSRSGRSSWYDYDCCGCSSSSSSSSSGSSLACALPCIAFTHSLDDTRTRCALCTHFAR
jgi:hypothetical protein